MPEKRKMFANRVLARLLAVLGIAATAEVSPQAPRPSDCPHTIVETERMRRVMATIDSYEPTTTNQSRFVADFLFGLARDPELVALSDTFQVQPERFIAAWREVNNASMNDAPVSMRKVLEFNQRFVVDTNPPARIDPASAEPRQVLSVHVSWPAGPDRPDHYTYHDRLTDPEVRMHQERMITYQLIDFGDFVAYENIEGVRGKPTSGALGALFKVLGMTRIHSTRFAVTDDNTQLIRSRVSKLLTFTAHATVTPDGRGRRGIPDDRPELEALADRLDRDLEIEVEQPPPAPCPVHE